MVVTSKMFAISATLVLMFLVIPNTHAGSLSKEMLRKDLSAQDKEKLSTNEGHNMQKRHLQEGAEEILKSIYTFGNDAFHNGFVYPVTQYGIPEPDISSFNIEHHGPYSHQYHKQFYNHHHHHHHSNHQPHHYPHQHYPNYPHHHHHHQHNHHNGGRIDCNHSDSSDSSSEENSKGKGKPKPSPPVKEKEFPVTSSPQPQTTVSDLTTTEVNYDIDVRLGDSS